ncbi:HdeD family acid-resistance protein [Propionicicella superfundia]|uniref:HdeD family acid-resistance protein n=1 Tax=Propionicicella superfundia TaxID=348582 RepID=UPI0003F6676A|nr:DUF308 domain-containing protein [Propionicicella superfundia]
MSEDTTLAAKAVSGIRILLGVGGAIAAVIGLLILLWPGKTAMVVAAIIAVYAICAGLVYAGMGVFAKTMGGWARTGHILLGVLYIVAGVVMLSNLGAAAAWLALLLGIVVGVVWIVDGIVALTMLQASTAKGWTVFYAAVSVLGGIVLLFSPLWGAVVLWWLLGITLLVMGLVQIIRAFRFSPEV